MNKVELFLKELRDSADIMYNIFTIGSCFRLFLIMRVVFENVSVYWSDAEHHAIVRVDDQYYDIGGRIHDDFVKGRGFFKIPEDLYYGYSLLKYVWDEREDAKVTVEKYYTPTK